MKRSIPAVLCLLVFCACSGGGSKSDVVTPPPPPPAVARLSFATQPSNVLTTAGMTPAVRVALEDASGNTVTSASNAVTLSLVGSATLSGTLTRAAVSGIATFEGLGVDRAGTYALNATSGSLQATSANFTVSNPPPVVSRAAFVVQPANALVGAALAPALRVALQDATGATVTSATDPVTVEVATGTAGAILSGTLTRAAVSGTATFDNLALDRAGTYTLTARSGQVSVTSTSFTITVPPPVVSRVAFVVQPGNALVGAAISPAIQVALQDATGATVTTSTNVVTIALASGTAGAVLSGTLSRAAVAGVATFAGIAVDRAGTYTVMAQSGELRATSAAFTISAPPSSSVVAPLSTGDSHACGITPQLETYCWGGAVQSVLGRGVGDVSTRFTPGKVSGGLAFTAVTAGGVSTCGLTQSGVAHCWGEGVVGDGLASGARPAPVPVQGGITFASIEAGGTQICGLTSNGAAYCWGNNSAGSVGDGTTTLRLTPVPVAGGLSFTTLQTLGNNTCALTQAGAAYCWGFNGFGSLGDGSTTNRSVPTPVSGGLSFRSITVGGHACGIATTGATWCWGLNTDGQLGDGSQTSRAVPVQVGGGLSFALVRAGGTATCGLLADGTAYCWGGNASGELGDGTTTRRLTPTAVAGGHKFRTLDVGGVFACGIATDNIMYCWGRNNFGQGGNATNTIATVPTPIFGTLRF